MNTQIIRVAFDQSNPPVTRSNSDFPSWRSPGGQQHGRRNLSTLVAAISLMTLGNLEFYVTDASAADEICASCGQQVSVSGDFAHRKDRATVTIEGGHATMPRHFVKKSTARISPSPSRICPRANTPSPSAKRKPGGRSRRKGVRRDFGRHCAGEGFRHRAAAGGARKVCYITGTVEHEDDSIKGPLKISFAAQQGRREIQHDRGEECLGRVGRFLQCFGTGGRFFRRGAFACRRSRSRRSGAIRRSR